jgi:hypothetical protein
VAFEPFPLPVAVFFSLKRFAAPLTNTAV